MYIYPRESKTNLLVTSRGFTRCETLTPEFIAIPSRNYYVFGGSVWRLVNLARWPTGSLISIGLTTHLFDILLGLGNQNQNRLVHEMVLRIPLL